ncbi:putative ferric reductase [Leishmania major strain Friedlin]|uniref:Putative ferric reductase n=1 Tax=Leishmania major TaxID=5664 RepID=Q4Q7E3_LEIMA|nr:putative ferric reductase [Leishmania major strain Friedlin]CAG9578384.1 ferric_reductase_transmembrane_protein_-_putative [Leishmania major strain Friedlin]CAJ06274.1 putative ferric reductase [Leishmania major strain Friedlin]|eukprot:XP_001684755.1 putative ferric reductase [Leishmania major strain Friedlin]
MHIAPLTLTAQLCYRIGGTVVCVFFTVFGYLVWRTQGYYELTPEGQQRSAGFTPNGIAGVTGFFTFAGLAVVLLIETTLFYVRYAFHPSHKGRYWTMHRYASVILQAALGILYVGTGVTLLVKWSGNSAQCAFIFCLGVDKYPKTPRTRGADFESFLSVIIFFVLVPAGLVLLYRVFTIAMLQWAEKVARECDAASVAADAQASSSASSQSTGEGTSSPGRGGGVVAAVATEANPMAKPVSIRPFQPKSRVKQVCRLVGVLIGILVCAILSFWLPNDSRRWNPNCIASFARNGVSRERRTTNMTVPEMPDAWFRTGQIRFSDDLTLKLFPGNVFFYVYLLMTAIVVLVLRLTQRGRYWVQRRIPLCACFTCGEAAFVAATALLSVMFFIYWLHDHNYKQTWTVTANESAQIEAPERWARGLGQLAILFLSLLLLPVSRQSVVVSVLGVSRDGMLWFHRAVGYAMLAATVGHIVAFYVSYASFGYLMQNLNTVTNFVCKKGVYDDYTVLVVTWTTWFLLISMGIFALNLMRRRHYELFYYTHLAATYMTLPAMLFHASAGWMYLLPGMTVLLSDQLVRLWQRSAVVRVVRARVIGDDTTELAFTVPGRWDMRRVHPGQYVLVCVPELTALQWHPFTLINVVDEESAVVGSSKVSAKETVFYVHVKSMGPKTWTGRLYDLVSRGEEITMAVEGPCGTPVVYRHYGNIVLVAGGIGATPCVSILGSLLRQCHALGHSGASPRVTFIWSTRSARHVKAVADMLQLPMRCGDVVRQPATRAALVKKIDTCVAPEDVTNDVRLNTEIIQPANSLEQDEPLNEEFSAVNEGVRIADDAVQNFFLDVYVTRTTELQHFSNGDACLGEQCSSTPFTPSPKKGFVELDSKTLSCAGAMGTVQNAVDSASPWKQKTATATTTGPHGKADDAEEAKAFSNASMGRESKGLDLTGADGCEDRINGSSESTAHRMGWKVFGDAASAMDEEGAFMLNGLSRWSSSSVTKSSERLHDNSDSSGSGCVALKVHSWRPDVDRLIREALKQPGSGVQESSKLDKARTLLFVCGPNSLVRQVTASGAQLGVAVHKEEFLF